MSDKTQVVPPAVLESLLEASKSPEVMKLLERKFTDVANDVLERVAEDIELFGNDPIQDSSVRLACVSLANHFRKKVKAA